MGSQMDNCCTCNQPVGAQFAGVIARYIWPGFPPFTSSGIGLDTLGVRFRTLTITLVSVTGATLVKSISSNAVNSTLIDTVTGSDASAAAAGNFIPGLGSFSLGPGWPPDGAVTLDTANYLNGSSMKLSDPVTPVFVQTETQLLLDSVDLASVPYGTDKNPNFTPVFVNPNRTPGVSNGIPGAGWLDLGVVLSGFNPDGSGIWKYAWLANSGGWITATPDDTDPAPNPSFRPFEAVAPALNIFDTGAVTGASASSYAQEGDWVMRKAKSKSLDGKPYVSVCCETDNFFNPPGSAPPSSCAVVGAQPNGELYLDRPTLLFEQPINSKLIIQTPQFGTTSLTNGGCPCQ